VVANAESWRITGAIVYFPTAVGIPPVCLGNCIIVVIPDLHPIISPRLLRIADAIIALGVAGIKALRALSGEVWRQQNNDKEKRWNTLDPGHSRRDSLPVVALCRKRLRRLRDEGTPPEVLSIRNVEIGLQCPVFLSKRPRIYRVIGSLFMNADFGVIAGSEVFTGGEQWLWCGKTANLPRNDCAGAELEGD
jgi:hypothetical protein